MDETYFLDADPVELLSLDLDLVDLADPIVGRTSLLSTSSSKALYSSSRSINATLF